MTDDVTDPSTSSGQAPSTSSGPAPSTSSGQAPSTSSGQAPSTSSGQAPSTSSGTDLRSGTETSSGTESEEPTRSQEPVDVARRVEAILLVVDEPHSLVALAAAVGSPVPAVRQAVEGLVADYDGETGGPRRGFELREVGGGWRLYVREEHDDLVSEFVNSQAPSRLSQAALETLAVIAYKQPVTRSQVASIRAVNVDSVVRTLVARGLITELYTDPETGAINYGTTDALLVNLGINSLDELPHISPLLDDGAEGFESEVLR